MRKGKGETTPPEPPGDAAYDIGYGKPPKRSQFRPGTSGNPKGRPPGAKNLTTHIGEELETRVKITEQGKRKTISKTHIIAKQLVNKAAGGDQKAIQTLLSLESASGGSGERRTAQDVAITEDDAGVLRDAIGRMRRASANMESTAAEEKSDDDDTK